MAAPRRLQMALLEHELAQARFQYNLVLAAILEAAERERQRARRRERRWWVREWILRRPIFGQYVTLMKELEAEHAADFKAFRHMEPQMYYELLNRVGPRITKNDAFPLRQYMLKPYPHRHLARDERIFNYRCSRARRVVENAFGILANRFISLLTTLGMRPSTVTKTVMACMTLHNLMRTRFPNIQNADLDREDEQGQFIAGAWRDHAVLEDVQAAGNGPRLTGPGKELRAYLKNYFCSPAGSVPWQDFASDADEDLDLDLDEDVGLDCDDFDAWDAWDAWDAMDSASDISDCSPS
ncbi:hypothetical protein MAR_035103, partial [Mya arenaria]